MGNRLTLPLLLAALVLAAGAVYYWSSGSGRRGDGGGGMVIQAEPAVAAEPARMVPAQAPQGGPAAEAPARVEVQEPAERPRPAAQWKEEALTVRGSVQDRFGTPVAGARVLAAQGSGFHFDLETEFDFPWLEILRAETDAEGRFELEGVEPGSLRVAVRAPGFAPLDRDGLRIPDEGTVELEPLVIARGAILTGMVIDPDGNGVGGVELIRQDLEARGPAIFGPQRRPTAVSAKDGSFRIDELACGAWRFLVRSEEHPDLLVEGLAEQPGVEVGGLRWQLQPGATISGQVSDVPREERGKLEVRAQRSGAPFGAMRSARVSEAGLFTLRGLEPGQAYELTARRAVQPGARDFWERTRSGRVGARAGDTGVVLPYQPEAALSFQVVDGRTRQPLEEIEVEAGIAWPEPQRDEQGRPRSFYPQGLVRVGGLRPASRDERVQLRVRAVGHEEYRRADIAVLGGQELDLGVIALEPVPVVRVHVVDARSGEPVEGAQVRLERDREGSLEIRHTVAFGDAGNSEAIEIGDGRSARTDERGWCELTSFQGATCKLRVTSDDHAPAEFAGLELPQGESVEHEVRLTPGGEVLVHVKDADGLPLAGARVAHRPPGGPTGRIMMAGADGDHVTDSAGQVLVPRLEAGLHGFRLDEGRGAAGAFVLEGDFAIAGLGGEGGRDDWSEVEVAEGARSEITLSASPRGSLTGRVREAGKLLAGATLRLKDAEGGGGRMQLLMPGMPQGPQAKSDGEGRYHLEDIEEGSYLLTVEHPTRRMPQQFALEVRAGENVFDVDLSLSIIEGRVLDREGKPLAGVRVWPERAPQEGGEARPRFAMFLIDDGGGGGMIDSGSLGGARAVSDAEGRYSLRGVESDVELVVRAEGDTVQPGESDPLRVGPDETRRGVDLALDAAGAIAVSAEFSDGAPARFCMVNATFEGEDPPEPKFAFIQSGSTTLRGLKPGRWRVNVKRAGPGDSEDPGEEQVIEVQAGDTAEASFRLD